MIRLAIRCRQEDAEVALAQLVDLAPSGIEEVQDGDIVEYAVYGPPGELPDLPDLQIAIGDALVDVRTTEVSDDWADRWKDFHRPVMIGDRLYVRPPWEESVERPGVAEVVIDPGRAFGTGAHATTRLCLELLLEVEMRGELVDLGCGSGVLAITAAKLGFAPIRAYDADVLAVNATLENARVNEVALASVERFDLRRACPPGAPTVVANLMRPLLLEIAGHMTEMPSCLIVSGLLSDEVDEVAAVFGGNGLIEKDRRELQGWAALMLAAP